jgi:hypothetical protein
MPLLPGCVRQSADASGATSDVYTDTFLCFCFFISFRSPAGLANISIELTQSDVQGVEVAASLTQTFTSSVSWDMWYLLGVLLYSTNAIFLTLDMSHGQSSETGHQARCHIKLLSLPSSYHFSYRPVTYGR